MRLRLHNLHSSGTSDDDGVTESESGSDAGIEALAATATSERGANPDCRLLPPRGQPAELLSQSPRRKGSARVKLPYIAIILELAVAVAFKP